MLADVGIRLNHKDNCPFCGLKIGSGYIMRRDSLAGVDCCENCCQEIKQRGWLPVGTVQLDYYAVFDGTGIRVFRVSSKWSRSFLVSWGNRRELAREMLAGFFSGRHREVSYG